MLIFIEFMSSSLMEVGDPRYKAQHAPFELLYIVADTAMKDL
jgi:hypothetical protein